VQVEDSSAEWRNLDSAVTRQAAASDPIGFVDLGEHRDRRDPAGLDLLLAIKSRSTPTRGRAATAGLLLVIDDLHRADVPSARLLQALAPEVAAC
jgi:hypothetical protein